MRRVFYHSTTVENAADLLRANGFCTCGVEDHHRGAHGSSPGVWLSNIPLLPFQAYISPERWTLDGQHGTAQLEVTIDATGAFMEAHEWKGEPLYREWLVAASEVNERLVALRILTLDEMAAASGQRVVPLLEYLRALNDEAARSNIVRSRHGMLKGLAKMRNA